MWRRNMSASIQNSSTSPSVRHSAREHLAAEARVLGLGRREGREVVPARELGARTRRQRLAVELAAATRTRGRARTRCARAARARGSSRSCCVASRRASNAAGAGSAASTATSSSQQSVQPQRIDRLVGVACHLPPGVHAAVGAPGDRQPSAARRRDRSRRAPCAAPARAPPAPCARPGWRAQPANPVPSYSIVSLVTIPRAASAASATSDELDEDHLGRVAACADRA